MTERAVGTLEANPLDRAPWLRRAVKYACRSRRRKACGSAGAFFLDVGISPTHHIARYWRLHGSRLDLPLPRRRCQQPFRSRLTTAALLSLAAEGAHSSAKASSAEGEERQTRYLPDPNAIIAAAFKAAGLPVPEIPTAPPGTPPRVAPGPIIAAALKAAGLVRS